MIVETGMATLAPYEEHAYEKRSRHGSRCSIPESELCSRRLHRSVSGECKASGSMEYICQCDGSTT